MNATAETAAPALDPAPIVRLRTLIELEPDVRRVLELVPLADGHFRYLIETPFRTFPKAVIGTTDADNYHVWIEAKYSSLSGAREDWVHLARHNTIPSPRPAFP